MRSFEGETAYLAKFIERDLEKREIGLKKPYIAGIADLTATVLIGRTINTSELANGLPRSVGSSDTCFKYIYRLLGNNKINPIIVLKAFVKDILSRLAEGGAIVSISLDQTQINKNFQSLMISARIGERAILLLSKVVQTKGAIGFDEQEVLIKTFASMVPSGISILFSADRFYGTSSLIKLVQSFGWRYRIRLKGNLSLFHQGGELVTGELFKLGLTSITNVQLGLNKTITNIGVLHEEGHTEAWIIAMECSPSEDKVRDYSMRWSCESLFSDLKSRGFRIDKTQLKSTQRIEAMLLIVAIATYWAVSVGMDPKLESAQPSKKKPLEARYPSLKEVLGG